MPEVQWPRVGTVIARPESLPNDVGLSVMYEASKLVPGSSRLTGYHRPNPLQCDMMRGMVGEREKGPKREGP